MSCRSIFATLSICLLSAAARAGDATVLYGVGDTPESELQVLYRIDAQSGEAEAIGPVGFDSCRGLDFAPNGVLWAACRRSGRSVLVELNRDSGAGIERLELRDPDLEETGHDILDLAFRRSDGALFGLTLARSGINAEPPSVLLHQLNLQNGSLTRLGQLSAGSGGLAFDPIEDALFTTESGSSTLDVLNPETGDLVSSTPLDQSGSYTSIDFEPATGLLWGTSPTDSNGSRLVRVEVITGQVSVAATLPFRLNAVAWMDNSETAPFQTILPAVSAASLSGGLHLSTSMFFRNFSATTADSAVEFFDSSGRSRMPSELVCPHLGGDQIGPREVLRLRTRPGVDSFDGWARLLTSDRSELSAGAAVRLLDGEPRLCGETTEQGDSRLISEFQAAAVIPERRFSAPVVIAADRESAFSIVNPSSLRPAVVTLLAFRDDGTPVDANEIRIPPRAQVTGLLFELLIRGKVFVVPPQRPDFRGQIVVTADVPIAVAGVDVSFFAGNWSTIPVSSP